MVAEFSPAAAFNLPPQNIDAEESLLGAILLDPGAISRVVNCLLPEAFFISAHNLIYKAALELFNQAKRVDLMSVTTWLYDHKKLDKVGGQCQLAQLVDRTVSSVNVDRDVELINDKYLRRQLIQEGQKTIQAAYETFRKLPEVFTEVKERLTALISTPLLSGEDPDQFSYNKLCLEIQQIELNVSDPGLRLWKLQKLATQYGRSTKQLEAIYFMSLLKEENESLLTWKELCDRYGDQVREWILHGFLPKGVTIAIHARGGVGKTRLVYDMLYSLLQGTSWNGFPSTGARRAILIQTDESAGDMLDALRRRGFSADMSNIRYKTRWTFEHISQLRAEMEEFKPEVIVIDSITSASRHSLFSENDVQYARPILKLKDLAQQYGCTIIIIHHSSKAGEARGTSAIFNSVSEVWKLEKDPELKTSDSTRRLLTIEKSRSRRPTTYRLDFNPEEGEWKVIGEVGVDGNNPDLTTKERIVEFLLHNLNVRYEATEITHEINGSPARVRLCCSQLAADGIISQTQSNKSRAKLYFIANHTSGTDRPSPSDRLSDQFLEVKKVIQEGERLGDQLNSLGTATVSDLSDRPVAKNINLEPTEEAKITDRAIASLTSDPEPSDIEENQLIASTDRPTDRLTDRIQGDQLSDQKELDSPEDIEDLAGMLELCNSKELLDELRKTEGFTSSVLNKACKRLSLEKHAQIKAWVVELNQQQLPQPHAELPHTPNLKVGSRVWYREGEFVGELSAVSPKGFFVTWDASSQKQAQRRGIELPTVCQLADIKHDVGQTAVTVSARNRPSPYHPRLNPPRKGDRICCNMDGRRGEIVEVRVKNPKYEILWEDGRKEAYDFQGLEVLDIRKED